MRILHRAWLGIAVAMGMNMVAFGISALGQEENLPGADMPLAETTTISVEQAQNRFKELERATDMDEGQKARLLELYRQIMTRLEAAKSDSEKAVVFRKALETAPRETANIREQLNEQMPSAIERELSVLSPDTTSEQLQQRLTQAQANLASLRGKQADLEKRIQEIQNRPAQARSQLTEAKTMLEKIQKELGGPAPSSEASETDQAQRWLLEIRQQARVSEIQMIDQELLSISVRQGLLTASRDFAAREVSQAEDGIQRLESKLSGLRQQEAERARQEAERLRREAIGKHRLVQQEAEEISELSQEVERTTNQIDIARAARITLETQLKETIADLEEADRTLELVGLSDSLGAVLMEQRRYLPDVRQFRKASVERATKIAEIRLRLFKIDRQLKELSDLTKYLNGLLAEEPLDGTRETAGEELRAELEKLLATKRENLERLAGTHRSHLDALGELESKEQELLIKAGDLANILDEHLLWIRSTLPISGDTFRGVASDFAWLFSRPGWTEVLRLLRTDFSRMNLVYFLVIGFVGLLLMVRRRLLVQMAAMAASVGKVRLDSLSLTVRSLIITGLISAPLPAVAGFLAWRLWISPAGTDYPKTIGFGLAIVAVAGLAIQFLRSLCRPGGVARIHFRWSEQTVTVVHRHLIWFLGTLIPCVFVMASTQWQVDPLYRNSLGRFAFIVLMLASSVLSYQIFRRKSGITFQSRGQEFNLAARTRRFWYPILIVFPLLLAALAAAGYYYTAVEFMHRFVETVLLVMGLVLAYAFLYRWLSISQRRLGMKLALEKREAQRKSREVEDEAEASQAIPIETIEEIDVVEVKEQTLHLLQTSAAVVLIVGLWLAWSGVLPALGIFDQVKVWDHKVMVEGQETLQPITLSNVGLAIIIILITTTAARNMPGFLEIALLQRMPLDRGTKYAVRTITLYIIVTLGIIMAFNSIGIGWPSVQWLVAALTVGLGFGMQEIFANFVSGLIILIERPIRVGDTVTIGAISGVVTRIRMRATTITDWSRKELVVPNKSFITGELVNWSLSDPLLRMSFVVGIAYGSDTTLAHKVMLQTCKEHPLVLDQPESNVFFTDFGDNSLNFECRVFVTESTNTGRTRIIHDLHMAIDQACRQHGITIAFPQRDLHLKTAEAVIQVTHVQPSEHE